VVSGEARRLIQPSPPTLQRVQDSWIQKRKLRAATGSMNRTGKCVTCHRHTKAQRLLTNVQGSWGSLSPYHVKPAPLVHLPPGVDCPPTCANCYKFVRKCSQWGSDAHVRCRVRPQPRCAARLLVALSRLPPGAAFTASHLRFLSRVLPQVEAALRRGGKPPLSDVDIYCKEDMVALRSLVSDVMKQTDLASTINVQDPVRYVCVPYGLWACRMFTRVVGCWQRHGGVLCRHFVIICRHCFV